MTKEEKELLVSNIIDIEKKIYVNEYLIIAILKSFKISKKQFDLLVIEAKESYLKDIMEGGVKNENNDK